MLSTKRGGDVGSKTGGEIGQFVDGSKKGERKKY